ncbi:hypothetical protein GO003_007375 [Methylicorpusculum oleiharenae]|uniref:hypothetical protein n=1 Tax=Methylicorpusculum oleiharenae TaxID=1338687 RepID=UPI001357965B|nr:hypothetical protein [Methylicorpusculum oleiharenae]MCD2450204.1 hypothetical protein [Methylicorpusculum oleiharenae]
MWIVKKDSFLSIVADQTNKETLLVRGRLKGDVEAVFPHAKVTKTPDADYFYRAFLPRNDVRQAISEIVESLDYPNFKSSVKSNYRHDIYMRLWQVMFDAQSILN